MSLEAGTKLGPYETVSALGAGGMGEVYRALDTKLGRGVAIKVLPEAFAFDPDRVSRFEREARVLGSLNHPHVAALHGMEEARIVVDPLESSRPRQHAGHAAGNRDRSSPTTSSRFSRGGAVHASSFHVSPPSAANAC